MQDYAKIMNIEQCRQRFLSMKILSQWCGQSKKNIRVSEKQKSIKSQIQSHLESQKQFQGKLRNRSREDHSEMTECQKRKYLLQIIK